MSVIFERVENVQSSIIKSEIDVVLKNIENAFDTWVCADANYESVLITHGKAVFDNYVMRKLVMYREHADAILDKYQELKKGLE